jgi:hypothetical protein
MTKKITPRQERALKDFFAAVQEMRESKIIRSGKYLGDIAEFICQVAFGIVLAKSGRQIGHDGMLGEDKVQVKYSGGSSRTVDCGDPHAYSILLIVVGPHSVMRGHGETGQFLIYQLSNTDVFALKKNDGKYHCGKKALPPQPIMRL